jgi:protocatechuate 3,4-dioxygenase beta subunit
MEREGRRENVMLDKVKLPVGEEAIDPEHQKRIKEVWRRCCEALQTVVTDMKITQDELKFAGQYFNRLGESGMFPNLLAVGLAMASMRATQAGGGTPGSLEGPYHVANAPVRADGVLLEKTPGPDARYLDLSGVVRDAKSGKPLENVELDFWNADENGIYDQTGHHLRGRVFTDRDGRYYVHGIVPKDYSEHDHDPIGELFRVMSRHNRRAAHMHLKINKAGYEPLTTQLFMPDGAYLSDDYVEGAVVPELIVKFDKIDEAKRSISANFDFAIVAESAKPA